MKIKILKRFSNKKKRINHREKKDEIDVYNSLLNLNNMF